MTDDMPLLRKFIDERAEPAFRELVRLRIDFVYATALRQVHGDSHLAQEVAQGVFLDLARKARELAARPNLTGWLYTSTRFAAAKALRSRLRRLNHETGAHAMQEILSARSPSETAWSELRPVLDAAMHELGEKDREAILLRYFESRSLAEVGRAIGLAENSARMRVDRAVEKLRGRLAQRGITSTAAALSAALMAQPAVQAPAGSAATIAGAALAGATAPAVVTGGFLGGAFQKCAAVGLAALVGAGAAFVVRPNGVERVEPPMETLTRLENENLRLKTELRRLEAQSVAEVAAAPAVPDPLGRLRAVVALGKEGTLGEFLWLTRVRSEIPRVHPSVADLFALTPAERSTLDRALEKAAHEIGSEAVARAKVQRAGNVLAIEIVPPEQGEASFRQLQEAFRAVLGEERFALYEAVGWSRTIRQWFDRLGLAPTLVTITDENFTVRPQVKYTRSETPLNGPRGGSVRSGGPDRRGLESNLGPFYALVPADF